MSDQPTDEQEWPDTGGCTEWSCLYHGEINRARAQAERARRRETSGE
ncbi:hypothetical protein ACIBH1_45365 [Nonomuraea sp. NPDC050663]